MISHVHRCIFIHVPKCGGTSIEAYLRAHASALGHLPEPGLDVTMRREGLTQVLNRYPDYFLFSFVRHPFDRLVSTWMHGLRGVGPYHDRPVRDLTLAEYVRIAAEGRIAEQSDFDRYHLLPQAAFIPGPSRSTLFGVPLVHAMACGFNGRFERLDEDFREVCRRIGIPERPLLRLQESLRVPGVHQPHWSARYDAAMIRLVQELYRDDMETFGYNAPTPA